MIHAANILPELSHVVDGPIPVFVTVEGRIGALFECPVLDLEGEEVDRRIAGIERVVSALQENTTLRVIQRASSGGEVGFETFRTDAVERVGFVRRRILLSVERAGADPVSLRSLVRIVRGKSGALQAEIDAFRAGIPFQEIRELGGQPLTIEDEFIAPDAEVSLRARALDFGGELVGVVRVFKPGTRPISEASLAQLLGEISLPFEASVSIRKIARHRADFRLRSQLARQELFQDTSASARREATEKALDDTLLFGKGLCEVEWLLILRRRDEASLRTDLDRARSILSQFGDAMIETVGVVPSYVASRPGAEQHYTFIDDDNVVPFYLPIFSLGEATPQGSGRSLLLHRLDGSLHAFDQFSPRFLAYNAIISGKTGSGKSVLANALSSALMQDPAVRMIKVDVGGSYRKECEVFGGTEVAFRLDAPSGVNPFRVFTDLAESNEAVQVVGEFLAALIREEDEKQIPKSVRAALEECLKSYAAGVRSSGSPGIDDFVAFAPELPRKALLSRWASGGVFENALKDTGDPARHRYRYFNFENIQAAAHRDYAEGVMAAVIADVNLEMLRLSHRSNGERLVLFCDETKFFLERFAPFFLLTAGNFRKFGHGLILLLQNIRDAEVGLPDGSVDRGLILNSPIRFFLQADTEADYLRDQFRFDESHLDAVVRHPYRGKEYREAVLQDDTGTRLVRLYLTDDEYWRMTSTKEDVEKFQALRESVPKLTVEEAIRCLAATAGR